MMLLYFESSMGKNEGQPKGPDGKDASTAVGITQLTEDTMIALTARYGPSLCGRIAVFDQQAAATLRRVLPFVKTFNGKAVLMEKEFAGSQKKGIGTAKSLRQVILDLRLSRALSIYFSMSDAADSEKSLRKILGSDTLARATSRQHGPGWLHRLLHNYGFKTASLILDAQPGVKMASFFKDPQTLIKNGWPQDVLIQDFRESFALKCSSVEEGFAACLEKKDTEILLAKTQKAKTPGTPPIMAPTEKPKLPRHIVRVAHKQTPPPTGTTAKKTHASPSVKPLAASKNIADLKQPKISASTRIKPQRSGKTPVPQKRFAALRR